MLNKIWNSKTMDTIGEIGYDILTTLGECLYDIFSHGNDDTEKEIGEETYEYWYNLTSTEREDYFKNNLVLQDNYGDNWYYEDRYQMAKHMKEIAQKEGREFTNKYYRY